MARIVGWKISDDETCACGRTANVIVEVDGYTTYPACNVCVPPGSIRDPIAEVFERVLSGKTSE